MLNKEQLEKELINYIAEKYPSEIEEYNLYLNNVNETDLESEFIKRTILDFQLSFHSDRYDSTSRCVMACERLADALNEKDILVKINELWSGKTIGLSVADLEYLILKSIKGQIKTKKFRIDDKDYSLSNLNAKLMEAKKTVYQLFGDIQKRYNIKNDFNWVGQMGQNKNETLDGLLK